MALHPYDLFDVRSLLNEEERAVQESVARFTNERVLPIIGDAFDQARFPSELVPEIASLGLLGATLPAEYGGGDLGAVGAVAGVFAARGHQGLVVHGGDGLDELTTTTSSRVWVHAGGSVTPAELEPLDLGLARADPAELTGGGPDHNAQVVHDVLAGRPGPGTVAADLVDDHAAVGVNALAMLRRTREKLA